MSRKFLKSALIAVAVIFSGTALGVAPANAVNIAWTGSGTTGQDPFGHTWTLGLGGWGIPGPGAGTVPWGGPDWITDFHITFTGLEIDQTTINATRMRNDNDGNGSTDAEWNTMFMGMDTAWFVAPTGVRLDPGEIFFVNVAFTTGTPSSVNFVAEYTMVPEPGTLAILGLGLAGLGLARRKRMI